MRALQWLTFGSFVLYNSFIVADGLRTSFPSPASYFVGLLAAVLPYATLLLAGAVGLPRLAIDFFALIGALALVFVAALIASGEILFVVPAILIMFGVFSAGALVFALIARLVRWSWHCAKRT